MAREELPGIREADRKVARLTYKRKSGFTQKILAIILRTKSKISKIILKLSLLWLFYIYHWSQAQELGMNGNAICCYKLLLRLLLIRLLCFLSLSYSLIGMLQSEEVLKPIILHLLARTSLIKMLKALLSIRTVKFKVLQ